MRKSVAEVFGGKCLILGVELTGAIKGGNNLSKFVTSKFCKGSSGNVAEEVNLQEAEPRGDQAVRLTKATLTYQEW